MAVGVVSEENGDAMKFFTHSFVCAVALCAGPLLAIAAEKPVAGDIVLVISGPFADTGVLIEESGGRMVGPLSGAMGTLAISQDAAFFDRLEENGAWAVTNGTLLAQICGVVF